MIPLWLACAAPGPAEPTPSDTAPSDTAPSDTAATPALPLPWSEGFEAGAAEGTVDGTVDDLLDLGWWTPSLAFTGNAWRLTQAQAAQGLRSAQHLRGTAGAGVLDDWLVSPALDLSGADPVMLTWQARGAATERAVHSLWLSAGSRDPADGDFVPVTALAAPPEGAWGRFVVDLAPWAGAGPAALAWRTEGQEADDWWIDEVQVGPRAPELAFVALSWSPDPAAPGQEVAVSVTVENTIDQATEGLVATLSLPEGGGTLPTPTLDLGTLSGLSTTTATWTVVLDPAWPLHSYLPLALSFTDGAQTWAWDPSMVVGLPSTATVAFSTDQAGTVALDLGVGEPDAALLAVEGTSGWYDAGSHQVQVDLTPYPSWLPPAAGEGTRWYARLTTSSDGQVDGFTITHGGLAHSATLLPALDAGLPSTVQVPSPAAPVLQALSPPSASPGVVGLALELTLNNLGANTVGPVSATLESDDPDATVYDGGPWALTDGPWSYYDARTLSGPQVDVAATHLDSSPVALRLRLDDGTDTWTVPVSLPVPWPAPRVTALLLDGDGLLSAGETTALTVQVGNGGGLDSAGEVRALLLAPSGEAVVGGEQALGTLAAGDSAQATWTVTAGGEALTLDLLLWDDRSSWTLPVSLPLDERPWLSLTPTDDAVGDMLDGEAADLVNARWRTDGLTFELLLLTAAPVETDTVFFELWGRSTDAPYSYYRLIVQPGATTLQGYLSGTGFVSLGALSAEGHEEGLLLAWSLSDLALAEQTLSLGLASGWCGPPEYFCDHLPDGWGYPYDSFSSGEWIPLSW